MIQINRYEMMYQSGKRLAIEYLEMSEKGLYLICGDNGSGKTTLVRSITGILNSYGGEITINGRDVKKMKREEIASVLSYLPQTANMDVDIIVEEFIRQGLYSVKSGFLDRVVSILELGKYLSRNFMDLSGGEKQMVRIARAIAGDVQYTFLDEPDSYLSKNNKLRFIELIDTFSHERCIVIVSHEELHFKKNMKTLLELT